MPNYSDFSPSLLFLYHVGYVLTTPSSKAPLPTYLPIVSVAVGYIATSLHSKLPLHTYLPIVSVAVGYIATSLHSKLPLPITFLLSLSLLVTS